MKDLIERLRRNADWLERDAGGETKRNIAEAADLLERIYSQPVELPEPFTSVRFTITDPKRIQLYTAEQLTKAVQEATAQALGAAAKKCEARYMGDNNREDMEAKRCASAIRNLIGRVK